MGKTRLAIVGASARAAAFSALRAGFDVVTADLFADEDLRRRCPATRISNYPEGLADWLAAQEVDAWMYTGALENYPDLVDRMAEIRPLWGNHGEALRRVRDPFALQALFSEAGVSFPETRRSAVGLPLDGSWLCKTYRGASGSGVWALEGQSPLDLAVAKQAVYQEFVDGVLYSGIYAVTANSARLLALTYQICGVKATRGKRFQHSISYGPCCLFSSAIEEQFTRVGSVLHHQLGLIGLVGVDFVASGHQVSVLEINPRYTASVEVGEALTGQPFLPVHRQACCREPLPKVKTAYERDVPSWQKRRSHGKAILFAEKTVTVPKSFVAWALQSQQSKQGLRVADIPPSGTLIRRGEPVVSLLIEGPWMAGGTWVNHQVQEIESRLFGVEA